MTSCQLWYLGGYLEASFDKVSVGISAQVDQVHGSGDTHPHGYDLYPNALT